MVTQESIEARIVRESYTILPSGKVTVCELVLDNGFAVVGKAGVVDKTMFKREVGEMLSRRDALEQIWQLEGYLAQENKYKGTQ